MTTEENQLEELKLEYDKMKSDMSQAEALLEMDRTALDSGEEEFNEIDKERIKRAEERLLEQKELLQNKESFKRLTE